ncbi:hypothetical protein [Pantoea dispersa]|nr:hypothetical protein [Pantoea dispersa]MCW0323434.1 hypothetical protein [Pantoea dispersa]MCW0328170.1 hypothetical protein [Pantoea dispersa]MCW0434631.1 hypothetical protein [Pantoea dispersa]RVU72252.1 hypothetical protein EKH82_24000 [Pantoea dispersa]
MFTTPFWPAADSYHIHMMDIPLPDSLSSAVLDLIHQATRLADAANHIHPVATRTGTTLLHSIEEKLSIICFKLAGKFTDPDTRKALQLRADVLSDPRTAGELLPQIAGLDEQELVQGIGYMSTWVGKSRAQHYSAWFGLPNRGLQEVSDVVDELFSDNLAWLQRHIDERLIALPGCRYKIVDLFAIAGEANSYPKHFAYFFPEDEGVKYAPQKRTIVFANTYLNLFERFARTQASLLGWQQNVIPESSICVRHLIAWFRGHDLGHSIVIEKMRFGSLSKQDRWGSMVIQEALADVFGLLMCLTEGTRQALQLDETHQLRVFLLEMLRYLRRGPCDYPDAGAAYIQLKWLTEHQCLYWNGTHYEVDLAAVKPALTALASAMTCSVLQGDTGKAEEFLQRYSPHHQREEAAMLLNRLGKTVDMIEYDQKIKGFIL